MTAVILAGVLMAFISDILFAIETLLCRLLDILYMTFEVFSGFKTVMYNGNESYLINVFFGNDVINAVYWGMACIGFALTFAFAIISVVKKLFDSTGEKVKATYTQILTNVFKAILLILLMTALVSAVINATGVLMQQVNYLFDNAVEMTDPSSITFDDTDYATMFRIMNTIGNYSLNPAYNSRYNINAMFNAIRPDMMLLAQQNVFHFTYEGAEGSWQHSLLQIYNAQDISCDVEIDVYNETLQNAMLDCISQIKNNKNFKPLSSYTRSYSSNDVVSQLGRIVMLCGSFEAAKNDTYNKNPGLTDNLRKPYYQGSKDVYDKGQVEKDFDIGLFDWNHVVTLVAAYFLIKEFAIILFNCVARIFNIILLYIAAPGFIAVIPLDDGGKMKQWTTAFVIQSLSIFGSVMAVRLLIIFIPIIMSPQLVLFESGVGNFIAKLILVLGVCVTAEKANGLISGILADNAGYQSIMAGDVGGGMVSKGTAIAGKVAGGVAKAGFKAGTSVLSGIGTATGLTTKANAIGDKVKGGIQSMKDMGGLRGAIKSGWQTKEGKAKQEKEDKEEAKDRDTADFRKQMLGFMGNMSEKMGGANQSGARGGEQGGAQGGEQGGNQGGEQGGNFGGNFGGMFGGNQGGNFGGEQGGNFGGNQGGNQGGNFGGNQGGNFGGNFGGNQGGAFGRTAKSIPRMGGFQQSSGQKNPTNHNNK